MKELIVYYSLEGNTEYAAERIKAQTGADTLKGKRFAASGSSNSITFMSWKGSSGNTDIRWR